MKALAAACGETREGAGADAIGGGLGGGRRRGRRAGGAGGGGIVPAFVVAPESTEEAAAVMRAAAEHELAVVVRGAGGRLGWGAPPSRCDLMIDMSRMSSVVEHSSGDLVARMQAGARMGDVAAALEQDGQELALDVPDGATVGGVVASGLAGPRRLRYGTPRDLLIGITIVRADGTVARSGGKVVKNVAGYDLGKLLAGSAGTLGADHRGDLPAAPAARRAGVRDRGVRVGRDRLRRGRGGGELAAGRLGGGAEPAWPGGPIRVGVLLEGSSEGVAARAMRMAGLLGPAETSLAPPRGGAAPRRRRRHAGPRLLLGVGAADGGGRRRLGRRGRHGVSPAIAGPAGAGVLYLGLDPDVAAPTSAGFVRGLRAALAGERGGVVVLAAPAAVREALAGYGGMAGTVPSLALMRAVKDQFDPGDRMAPGRFPEVM